MLFSSTCNFLYDEKTSHFIIFYEPFAHTYYLGIAYFLVFFALKSTHPFPVRVLIKLTYFSLCFFLLPKKVLNTELYHTTTGNLLWIHISRTDQYTDAIHWLWTG